MQPYACLASLNQADVIEADLQIQQNAGIPTPDGKTTNWDIPKKAFNHNFWFIVMPPENGWNGISQEQMMQNVVNVTQEMCDASWFPPSPFPPNS